MKLISQTKKNGFEHNLQVQRETLCEHLTDYFSSATPYEIHPHLINYGLFVPDPLDKQVITEMIDHDYWSTTEEEIKQLSQDWLGPDIPIFIFPSNYTNELLRTEFNSLSGLSYQDKMFLFVTNHTITKEIRALITHEYNHVCRLSLTEQQEEELDLLDALVLEGIAEHAVKQRIGPEHITNWTKLYSYRQAQEYWAKWIKPNLMIKKADPMHDQLMYGTGKLPKWLGYNSGYHLISSYIKNTKTPIFDLLRIPSSTILEHSAFC